MDEVVTFARYKAELGDELERNNDEAAHQWLLAAGRAEKPNGILTVIYRQVS
jgi:hypothetical protein